MNKYTSKELTLINKNLLIANKQKEDLLKQNIPKIENFCGKLVNCILNSKRESDLGNILFSVGLECDEEKSKLLLSNLSNIEKIENFFNFKIDYDFLNSIIDDNLSEKDLIENEHINSLYKKKFGLCKLKKRNIYICVINNNRYIFKFDTITLLIPITFKREGKYSMPIVNQLIKFLLPKVKEIGIVDQILNYVYCGNRDIDVFHQYYY